MKHEGRFPLMTPPCMVCPKLTVLISHESVNLSLQFTSIKIHGVIENFVCTRKIVRWTVQVGKIKGNLDILMCGSSAI